MERWRVVAHLLRECLCSLSYLHVVNGAAGETMTLVLIIAYYFELMICKEGYFRLMLILLYVQLSLIFPRVNIYFEVPYSAKF